MLQYEEKVRAMLCGVLGNDSCLSVPEKDDLQFYGMDSLNCMQVIIAIEDSFNIEIPEEKLGQKFVRNIYDICMLIEEVKISD